MTLHFDTQAPTTGVDAFDRAEIGTVVHRLERTFDGAVHLPGDPGYDEHRRALIPTLDPHPALVVEAVNATDVRAAVEVARAYELPLAVQATGHGTRVPCDGGLLLKTSSMRSVLVDPHRRIARVGPGARWAEVLIAASACGLAPLSGSSPTVGVTGYTLGGGVGWLARKHGLAADSVVRAEVVDASGRLVTASPDSHPDLFWALRGGGSSFGVVTSLEFRLHPVSAVYGGISYFPIERAGDTMAYYREWTALVPDELGTALTITRVPAAPHVPEALHGRRAVAIKVLYAGAAVEAERLLRSLRDVAGTPLLNGYRSMEYADAAMGGTPATYLDLADELPDPMVEALVDAAAPDDSPVSTVEIRHWGGAMSRMDAGPAGHRTAQFSVIVDTPTPELTTTLTTQGTGRTFLNFLGDTTRTATAFTPENFQRLREIKGSYDPDNLFRIGHTIPPTTAAPRLAG